METINRIYHEEPPEYFEEVKQKQEITKKLLHALLIQPETIESWKILYGIEILPEAVEIIRIDLEGSPDPEDGPDPENGFDDEFDNEFELGMYQHFEDNSDLEDECEPEDFFFNCVAFRKYVLFVAKLNENSSYQIEYASEVVNEHMSLVIKPTEYSIDFTKPMSS
ncbi:MAG: hypothetical protein AB9861_12345 [Methanosarcina sp.]